MKDSAIESMKCTECRGQGFLEAGVGYRRTPTLLPRRCDVCDGTGRVAVHGNRRVSLTEWMWLSLAAERQKNAELTEMLRTITEEKAGPWFARLVGKEAEIRALIHSKCRCAFTDLADAHFPDCKTGSLRRLLIEGETQRQVDAAHEVALDGDHRQGPLYRTLRVEGDVDPFPFRYQGGALTGRTLRDSVPYGRGGHMASVVVGGQRHGAVITHDDEGASVVFGQPVADPVHLLDESRLGPWGICGREGVAAAPIQLSRNRSAVTCVACRYAARGD